MVDINLLPPEYGPDPAVARISSKIARIAVVEFVIVVVVAVIGIGSFVVLSRRLAESSINQTSLKNEIASLESTEQRLYLLKDRIDKSSTVLATESANGEVSEFDFIQSNLPPGVEFKQVEFFTNKLEVVYSFADSNDLVSLLLQLETSGRFSTMELLSINYTQVKGYDVALVLIQ